MGEEFWSDCVKALGLNTGDFSGTQFGVELRGPVALLCWSVDWEGDVDVGRLRRAVRDHLGLQ